MSRQGLPWYNTNITVVCFCLWELNITYQPLTALEISSLKILTLFWSENYLIMSNNAFFVASVKCYIGLHLNVQSIISLCDLYGYTDSLCWSLHFDTGVIVNDLLYSRTQGHLGQHKAKPLPHFSHTFHLIRMKLEMVFKQFKLKNVILLLGEI